MKIFRGLAALQLWNTFSLILLRTVIVCFSNIFHETIHIIIPEFLRIFFTQFRHLIDYFLFVSPNEKIFHKSSTIIDTQLTFYHSYGLRRNSFRNCSSKIKVYRISVAYVGLQLTLHCCCIEKSATLNVNYRGRW